MSTHYDRLSAAVNRLSESPLISDQWLILADNWLLTADVLSPILALQYRTPYTTWSKRHENLPLSSNRRITQLSPWGP